MAVLKLSQIATGSAPALTDTVIGVVGSTTDQQYTVAQLQSSLLGIGSAIAGGTPGSVLFVDAAGKIGQDNAKFFWDDTNFSLNLGGAASLSAGGLALAATNLIGWNADLFLARDAANTLTQQNGTNPQTFRVYNTFTNSTNYERGIFDWQQSANILTIGTEAAGTGAQRDVQVFFKTNFYLTDKLADAGAGAAWNFFLSPNTAHPNLAWNTPGSTYNVNMRVVSDASAHSVFTIGRALNNTGSVITDFWYFVVDTGLLGFGGTTSLFPGLINSSTKLVCKLADNSANADFQAKTLQTDTVTVASLPVAGTKGRRYFVTDANATTYQSIVVGGGANNVPVFDDGANWRIG